jgi:cephalosporin hydroxylase
LTTLDQIARNYNTDKFKHGFTNIYPFYFEKRRQEPIKLLEIGVNKGGSILMWKEYFDKGKIFGIDITPISSDRISKDKATIILGNQEDREFLNKVGKEHGPFDFIVDDGGHTMNQQKVSLEVLWEYVNPKGVYVTEDIDTSYIEKYGGGTKDSFVEYVKNKIEVIVQSKKRRTDLKTDMAFIHFWEELVIIGKK